MTDWQQLTEAGSQATPDEIKKALPVAFVLEQAGFAVSPSVEDGKLNAPCPFHEGDRPLDIWKDQAGNDRWACFPCAYPGGDVLDLVSKLNGDLSFSAASAAAQELLRSPELATWAPPVVSERKSLWDDTAASAAVSSALVHPPDALSRFLTEKAVESPALRDVTAEDLRDDWSVGSLPSGEIVIPYFTREDTRLVAYKRRTATTRPMSAPGSTLSGILYGEWRDLDDALPVLLCEGESDTWAASYALPEYACLGLPAGAGGHTSAARTLRGRRVVLAFDSDAAGRAATEKWTTALLKEGCEVEMVRLPQGADLSSVPDVRRVVESTRHLKPAPDRILEDEASNTYLRPGSQTNPMLTNWRFVPETELRGPSGLAYEGTIQPGGFRTTISSGDLLSKARIVAWCSRHGLAWLGTDGDAQQLAALLQHKGPFLAAGDLVQHAGLYRDTFVWPGGRIGPDPVVFSPPTFDIGLQDRIAIPLPPARYTAAQVPALRDLHRTDVMDPFLAWLAVAPLRSTLDAFPILAITGSSGSGKTTLIDAVVSAFTGSNISTNLTSTTKHALAAFVASTNAFPVWFDEYRPGARKDTLLSFEQLLRDAYTGQVSSKGGLGEHWSEVSAMQTHSPIIVSGEDTFHETSHTERMVNLALPSAGKNPAALRDVQDWGPTGLPYAYLSFLARYRQENGVFPTPYGDATLPTRQRHNLGVLKLGWDLLTAFCAEQNLALPPPNFSLVERMGLETAGHNPIKDALVWALDEPDAFPFVRQDPEQGFIYLRVENFVQFVSRQSSFQLPGRSEAIRRYLMDNYEGIETKADFGGKKVSCLQLTAPLVFC